MVRCAECGFLAMRHLNTRELREVEEGTRENGERPMVEHRTSLPADRVYVDGPLCFEQQYPLMEEWKEAGGDMGPPFLSVINTSRECAKFTQWCQGFTPKEHWEMLDRQRALKEEWGRMVADRQWREGQAKDERAWREQQALAERGWREDQAEKDRTWRAGQERKRERNENARLAIMVAAILAAGIAGAAVGARIAQTAPIPVSVAAPDSAQQ